MNDKLKVYNSNANLKGANQSLQFTQEQIAEYLKCAEDPIYFIETYCQIVTLDHGLQPFKLYDCQKKKIGIIHSNRKVILMEGRQQGKTTTSAAYILWYTLFSRKTVAILANKAAAAREVLYRYQTMYEHLPKWLQQGVTTWNKGDIELENGSKVFTAATSASGIRGKSVNFLYVDETAIIQNTVAEDFFTSTYPTISAGKTTKIVLTSTPLGYNHFWHFWQGAIEKINGFIPIEVKYWEHPDRDEAWANKQKELLGELKFNQEVMCNFLGSALTLIRADAFAKMVPKKYIYQSEDGLDVLEAPIAGHAYVIIADTAEGVGGDFSAFTVVDVTQAPYVLVAKYRNNRISPLLYPNAIYKIAREYNEAYVLLEINKSEQVAHIFHYELEYENILFVTRGSKGQVVSGGFGAGKSQLGVVTDKKVKRIGCMNFKALVEENKLLIQDKDVISEISTFIQRKDSYAADDGYHDDLVMTLVLLGWLTTSQYFKDINNLDLRKVMYQNQMKQIDEEMTPIGWFNDGSTESEPVLLNF